MDNGNLSEEMAKHCFKSTVDDHVNAHHRCIAILCDAENTKSLKISDCEMKEKSDKSHKLRFNWRRQSPDK